MIAGPDAAALVSYAAGRPLLLTDVRDLSKPEVMAERAVLLAEPGRMLCGDGLERPRPTGGRSRSCARSTTSTRTGSSCSPPTRSGALTLGDRTVLLVEVPMPTFGERQAAWSELTGAEDMRDVSAKFQLSLTQIRQAAEVATITAQSRNGDAPAPEDLDRGARHASSSLLGELATRFTPRYRWAELVLPNRQREVLGSISAYLRHRDRVLSEWGYERAVARTQGLKVLSRASPAPARRWPPRCSAPSSGSSSSASTSPPSSPEYIGET